MVRVQEADPVGKAITLPFECVHRCFGLVHLARELKPGKDAVLALNRVGAKIGDRRNSKHGGDDLFCACAKLVGFG